MNLLHMNYFIAVVEHQSISRAAQSLFITQQTLSSHIASMAPTLPRWKKNWAPVFLNEGPGSASRGRERGFINIVCGFVN